MWTFLNQGIDPNARNAAGMTPLFYVRSKPVAKMLLDEGASPAARDNEGRTALKWHIYCNHHPKDRTTARQIIIDMLREHNTKVASQEAATIRARNKERRERRAVDDAAERKRLWEERMQRERDEYKNWRGGKKVEKGGKRYTAAQMQLLGIES